jgi:FKBP-type peptidyl-prolyl cis-trans isomerase (trigger factor)
LRDDLNKQATRNLTMVVILDKVIEELDIKLEEEDTALIEDILFHHFCPLSFQTLKHAT